MTTCLPAIHQYAQQFLTHCAKKLATDKPRCWDNLQDYHCFDFSHPVGSHWLDGMVGCGSHGLNTMYQDTAAAGLPVLQHTTWQALGWVGGGLYAAEIYLSNAAAGLRTQAGQQCPASVGWWPPQLVKLGFALAVAICICLYVLLVGIGTVILLPLRALNYFFCQRTTKQTPTITDADLAAMQARLVAAQQQLKTAQVEEIKLRELVESLTATSIKNTNYQEGYKKGYKAGEQEFGPPCLELLKRYIQQANQLIKMQEERLALSKKLKRSNKQLKQTNAQYTKIKKQLKQCKQVLGQKENQQAQQHTEEVRQLSQHIAALEYCLREHHDNLQANRAASKEEWDIAKSNYIRFINVRETVLSNISHKLQKQAKINQKWREKVIRLRGVIRQFKCFSQNTDLLVMVRGKRHIDVSLADTQAKRSRSH